MIISNTICTRLIGDDRVVAYKRLWVPFIIIAEAYLWSVFNWEVALLAGVAFCLWRYDGWGEQFLAMHGDKKHYDNRNKSKFVTKIADYLYKPKNKNQRKLYGIIWGGLRGLYDVPAFIALAVLLQNYQIAFLGLLMGLQGVVYYLAGCVFSNKGTPPAELAIGGYRGILWTGAVYV